MIDLKHKYALLEDGTVESLYYENGEPREAYQDYDGKYYLVHDRLIRINRTNRRLIRINGANRIALCYSRIVATADDIKELEVTNEENT